MESVSRLARNGRNAEAYLTEPAGNTTFDLKPAGARHVPLDRKNIFEILKDAAIKSGR